MLESLFSGALDDSATVSAEGAVALPSAADRLTIARDSSSWLAFSLAKRLTESDE